MNCCNEYGDCQQGRNCPARITREEMGDPFVGSKLDMALAVVAFVFAASCLGYLIGGIR